MEQTISIISELETKVIDFIQKDNINRCNVEFVYAPGDNNGVELLVITHNPIHGNPFLFSKSWGVTEEQAISNLIFSLEHPSKKEEKTFTITWEKIGGSTQNSYFSGNDMYEVLDKFFHGKTLISLRKIL